MRWLSFLCSIIFLNTSICKSQTGSLIGKITDRDGYNTQSTLKSFYPYNGRKTDFLGIDDGTINILENFPSSDQFIHPPKQKKLGTVM